MKTAEVQLPDPLYKEVEGLAKQLHLSVPDVLRRAAEQLVRGQSDPNPKATDKWIFPEGISLGKFHAPVEEWRLLANDSQVE